MIIMSVDYGDARTGLAICDKTEMLASPVQVIHQRNREKLLEQISELAREHRVEQLVVGHPLNMNGTAGERARLCREFAQSLEEACGLPAVLWDERGTTVTAHSYLNVTDTRGKKRKNVVDAVAAVIILENYLDFRKNNQSQE